MSIRVEKAQIIVVDISFEIVCCPHIGNGGSFGSGVIVSRYLHCGMRPNPVLSLIVYLRLVDPIIA